MSSAANGPEPSAAAKTLADAKFVVGDYISVAVLPPDGSTGAVAPASGARAETGSAGRRGEGGGVPPLLGRRVNGFVAGPARGGREGRGGRFGRGDRERTRDGYRFPEGEWRRGERLPEVMNRGGRRGPRW
jgi:histone deacetylase complex subunit SAP18